VSQAGPRISKQLADLSESTLRFYRQAGVEEVTLPARYVDEPRNSRPHVPPTQTGPAGPQPPPWTVEELTRMRERAAAFDLDATTIALPVSGAILMGLPEREADFETIRRAIGAAGRAGLSVLTYNFTALRASEGYFALDGAGRGGAHLRGFDDDRIRDLPPYPTVGEHSREQMWDRLVAFLRAVVPAAESAGVRLAMHPNDPPVPIYRGVAQPARTLQDWKDVVATVDSPANTLFFDTGVSTELGEDAPEAIRYFGSRDRIGTVHFRNVRVEVPYERYTEVFLDDGDCDVAACMRAFHEVGYRGGIDPDHSPGFDGDGVDTHVGWAFAIGQLIALRAATRPTAGR